jgi:two-component system LytT family response regulator
MRHRVMIIEDEEHSRARLARLLASHGPDFELVGTADDGEAAVERIKALRPDLIFLDIRLPGLDGFEVLQRLDRQPTIIFTTANEAHALQAFRTNAIHYLLKPIEAEALANALAKFRNMAGLLPDRVAGLADMLRGMGNQYLSRIPCKVGEHTYLVKTGEVLYFQAQNKYTTVQTSGKTYLIDTSLVDLEKQLDPRDFLRIHRGTLVNLSWIVEIRRKFDGKVKVVLLNKESTELPVSRMFAENLKNIR